MNETTTDKTEVDWRPIAQDAVAMLLFVENEVNEYASEGYSLPFEADRFLERCGELGLDVGWRAPMQLPSQAERLREWHTRLHMGVWR
jgi:hypothetical protein